MVLPKCISEHFALWLQGVLACPALRVKYRVIFKVPMIYPAPPFQGLSPCHTLLHNPPAAAGMPLLKLFWYPFLFHLQIFQHAVSSGRSDINIPRKLFLHWPSPLGSPFVHCLRLHMSVILWCFSLVACLRALTTSLSSP